MEQTQTKISKYAAKQARLAADPDFGTDYSDHLTKSMTKSPSALMRPPHAARRKAMDEAKQQYRFDKIYNMQTEIHALERRIENAKAHIVKLTAAIERQKKLLLQ